MKALLLLLFILSTTMNYGQSIPTEEELHEFLNGKQLMITYREGEALYGTYYFIEVHYCPNGYYGLYANTVKRTVLGNEQKGGWQEYGQWQVQNHFQCQFVPQFDHLELTAESALNNLQMREH